jgi:hypothetical protein
MRSGFASVHVSRQRACSHWWLADVERSAWPSSPRTDRRPSRRRGWSRPVRRASSVPWSIQPASRLDGRWSGTARGQGRPSLTPWPSSRATCLRSTSLRRTSRSRCGTRPRQEPAAQCGPGPRRRSPPPARAAFRSGSTSVRSVAATPGSRPLERSRGHRCARYRGRPGRAAREVPTGSTRTARGSAGDRRDALVPSHERVAQLVELLRRRRFESGEVLEVGAWFGSFSPL